MQQLVGTVIAFDCGRGLSSYISKESWPADRNGNTATPDGVPYDPVLMVVKNEHLEARGAPATTWYLRPSLLTAARGAFSSRAPPTLSAAGAGAGEEAPASFLSSAR